MARRTTAGLPYTLEDLDAGAVGFCDTCGIAYATASADDHCTECGRCDAHCRAGAPGDEAAHRAAPGR